MSRDLKSAINASTQLYGIFGNPVNQSLSPLIHNAAFGHFGLNAAYMAFTIQEGYLGMAFEALRAMGAGGVNVTIPYKEEALGFIDEVPEDIDRCTGAINTVKNESGKLIGYNTDGPGFLTAIHEELSFKPEGKSILVLGAGGAARGVVFSLARAHADKIWVFNRTAERAEGLLEHACGFFPETEFEIVRQLYQIQGEKIDLVINATRCGMKGNPEIPLDLRILEQKTSVYDLVYSPVLTPFLKTAQELHLPYSNGLGMLINQAVLSFEIWTGLKEGVREIMRSAFQGENL